jgi:hypothetical protein
MARHNQMLFDRDSLLEARFESNSQDDFAPLDVGLESVGGRF